MTEYLGGAAYETRYREPFLGHSRRQRRNEIHGRCRQSRHDRRQCRLHQRFKDAFIRWNDASQFVSNDARYFIMGDNAKRQTPQLSP